MEKSPGFTEGIAPVRDAGGAGSASSAAATSARRSPARVRQARATLAGSSITQNAVGASARRHGCTAVRTLTTRPSRDAKTTSMGKRMNQVWTAFVGAMTIAWLSGKES
jgi:hypothetical protein